MKTLGPAQLSWNIGKATFAVNRRNNKEADVPDLIKEGTAQYGMQSFDQSLMQWFKKGVISYESAIFYATSPAEFALRVQGVAGTSDQSWNAFEKK